MAYTGVTEVRRYLRGLDLSPLGDTTVLQDAEISDAIEKAARQVDHFTHRTFITVTETRTFDGKGRAFLPIPDLLSLNFLEIYQQRIPISEILTFPYNQLPTTALIYPSGVFPLGAGGIKINGLWGFSTTVPPEVAEATALLSAADILSRLSGSRDQGTSSIVQGALSQHYQEGAYAQQIDRYTLRAYHQLCPFVRWSLV